MSDPQVIGITGGHGILGSVVATKCREQGLTTNLFPGDVTCTTDVRDWIAGDVFEAILHLAAVVPVSKVETEPESAMRVNAGGTHLILDILREVEQKPWFFYASTSHVYKPSDSPLNEEAPLEPLSTYGATKLRGEEACLAAAKALPVCIGRIFSYYHSDQAKPFLYPSILERLESEDLSQPFELYGANSTRDFLSAEDVADIILALLARRPTGVFNIASGKPTSVAAFVQSLAPCTLDIVPKGSSNHLVADVEKLSKVLNT